MIVGKSGVEMARTVGKLTALKVARVLAPGMYADGAGLYLQVTGVGAKSWIYRFSLNGKAREMGLGSLAAVNLSEARIKAGECRRLRQQGSDPIEERKARRQKAELEAAKTITFKEAAANYIASHCAGWRNAKHAAQWGATLATYAEPALGAVSIQAIDTELLLKVLEPIWQAKPETANRLRGRIEAILDWAKVRGLREGENPARWRGHLQYQLPAKSKLRRVKHHAALSYAELPEFISELREQGGVAARALEFTILTAARTGETIGAVWGEFNASDKLWILPAERMKGGKEHRVPLTARVLAILRDAERNRTPSSDYVFVGGKLGKPLSNMAMMELLRRMDRRDITVHGFRSTFRDWAAERTNFQREVSEMALAHAVGDKVEAAYRRGDLFEKRRRLMAEWTVYCNTPKAAGRDKPIPMRRSR
jgi:integrase